MTGGDRCSTAPVGMRKSRSRSSRSWWPGIALRAVRFAGGIVLVPIVVHRCQTRSNTVEKNKPNPQSSGSCEHLVEIWPSWENLEITSRGGYHCRMGSSAYPRPGAATKIPRATGPAWFWALPVERWEVPWKQAAQRQQHQLNMTLDLKFSSSWSSDR